MKKDYMKPTTSVVFMQATSMICTSGEVTNTESNADLNYGGGGSGAAMSREGNWDDED